MPGSIIIISGPSQVGKDAVVKELSRMPTLNLARIITVTTREQRPEEVDGVDHYFVNDKEFDARVARGEFLEWAPVRNRKFATPRRAVEEALTKGRNVLLKIDVRGAKQVIGRYADAVRIFIEPDGLESIRRRMVEKGFSDEQLDVRWREAMDELKAAHDYDYRVVNNEGKLSETVEKIAEVILHLPLKG